MTFSAWISSLPAMAPGVSAAFFNRSYVAYAAASRASASARDSASAVCAVSSGAVKDTRRWPLLHSTPSIDQNAMFAHVCKDTRWYGRISPLKRSSVRAHESTRREVKGLANHGHGHQKQGEAGLKKRSAHTPDQQD